MLNNADTEVGGNKIESIKNSFYAAEVICLHFSAWDHENPNGLVSAMMTELAHIFKEDAAIKDAFLEAAGALGGLVSGIAIRLKSFNMLGLSDVVDTAGKLKKDAEAGIKAASYFQEKMLNEYLHDEHNKLKNSLEKAAQALGNKSKRRIALLIDDLDRCNPDNIFMFLDSLRRLISLTESITSSGGFEGFVGIIAADPDIIRQAIKAKYPGFEGDPLCYMDKLFTITHTLPEPDETDWRHYLTAQWTKETLPEMVITGGTSISKFNYLDPLITYFKTCNGALTPRHANTFLRHLKIAIATDEISCPSFYFPENEALHFLPMTIGFALIGIAAPYKFEALIAISDNIISEVIIEDSAITAEDIKLAKQIKIYNTERYELETGGNYNNDWNTFTLTPIFQIMKKLIPNKDWRKINSGNTLIAARKLLWK